MRLGFARLTADGVLNTSGKPVAIHSIHIVSGGTAGVVILRHGTAVTDTATIQETGTANTGKTVDFGANIVFPSGCFVDIDANVTYVTIVYETVS